MQLSFLGQSYEASFPTVDVAEAPETGTFLGKHYIKKQFNVDQYVAATSELTYRGARYRR